MKASCTFGLKEGYNYGGASRLPRDDQEDEKTLRVMCLPHDKSTKNCCFVAPSSQEVKFALTLIEG